MYNMHPEQPVNGLIAEGDKFLQEVVNALTTQFDPFVAVNLIDEIRKAGISFIEHSIQQAQNDLEDVNKRMINLQEKLDLLRKEVSRKEVSNDIQSLKNNLGYDRRNLQ